MSEAVGAGGSVDSEALIEDFGVHIGGAMGWPRMAGRAAGVLMLSETPMTMPQLQDALNASKGSVSETTRLLVATGTVERLKEKGSRQSAYRWRDDAWIGCLQHQLEQTMELLALAERARLQGSTLPPEQQGRLVAMHQYYTFMVERLATLVTEYSEWVTTNHGEHCQRSRNSPG